ncbi:transcription initiation factor TFIID subunit 8-like [Octopus sinensis]|uniref:Transcription initiation factor TFIID subunit 8 n=1 Tax=Octopus sinensis TaxID=2607531 RepID=A0A6P7U4Z6_9MOLL|nr:transcription initiation factor TFIID subunit 8-like [Octopus sinensis]
METVSEESVVEGMHRVYCEVILQAIARREVLYSFAHDCFVGICPLDGDTLFDLEEYTSPTGCLSIAVVIELVALSSLIGEQGIVLIAQKVYAHVVDQFRELMVYIYGGSLGACKKTIRSAVMFIAMQSGYEVIEEAALSALVELLIVCNSISITKDMCELTKDAHDLCEHSSRTLLVPRDVQLAYTELGGNIEDLISYGEWATAANGIPPNVISVTPERPLLTDIGDKQPLPSHLPDHVRPFPDPHTYLRTPSVAGEFTDERNQRIKSTEDIRSIFGAVARLRAHESTFVELGNTDFRSCGLTITFSFVSERSAVLPPWLPRCRVSRFCSTSPF